jgi:hypothetical protein
MRVVCIGLLVLGSMLAIDVKAETICGFAPFKEGNTWEYFYNFESHSYLSDIGKFSDSSANNLHMLKVVNIEKKSDTINCIIAVHDSCLSITKDNSIVYPKDIIIDTMVYSLLSDTIIDVYLKGGSDSIHPTFKNKAAYFDKTCYDSEAQYPFLTSFQKEYLCNDSLWTYYWKFIGLNGTPISKEQKIAQNIGSLYFNYSVSGTLQNYCTEKFILIKFNDFIIHDSLCSLFCKSSTLRVPFENLKAAWKKTANTSVKGIFVDCKGRVINCAVNGQKRRPLLKGVFFFRDEKNAFAPLKKVYF